MVLIVISIVSLNLVYDKADKSKNATKTSVKIGVTIYNQYDTFISSLVNYLTEYAKYKERDEGITITLDISNAGGNQLTQNYQVENYIREGYDIICINLVDRTDASVAIDMAINADIPIIFFNRELVEKDLQRWNKLFYVGAVALESGIMQGQIVVDYCEKNFDKVDKNKDGILQYVILEGEPGHQDALIRTECVINTIIESGIAVEKVGDEIANWTRAQAETKMSQWLKNDVGKEIEIVIANNDDMALGAIDAIKKEEIVDYPIVVGIDGTKVGLEAVKNGDMIGTVYNDAKGQAEGIVELAYSLAFGEPLPENIELIDGKYIRKPHIIITPDNVEQYMD
ncbi:MAG: galactose ABC transporter substrate-binding protein [Clostridiales bacterium]|nr:galactose ABC transporter substrate-binding protein [Clostridiales bacterium]